MKIKVILLIIILSLSVTAGHEATHLGELTLEDFELGAQNPAQFQQLSVADQQQYLRNQVEAGAQIHNDPELFKMASGYVQKDFFEPEKDGSDFEIGENLFNNPDSSQNAETVNKAPKGFQKIRRASGNKRFKLKGKVRKYNSAKGTLSTAKQTIKLNSFKDDSIAITVTEKDTITFTDSKEEEHTFEGTLDAFALNPLAGKLLLIKKGSIDGHEVTDVAFRITEDGFTGSATTFDSIEFSERQKFIFEKETGATYIGDDTIVMSVKDGKIVGENIKLPNGDLLEEGEISYTNSKVNQIGQQTAAIVGGIQHLVSDKPLEIRYATNDELFDLQQQEQLTRVPYQKPELQQQKDEAITRLQRVREERKVFREERNKLLEELKLKEDASGRQRYNKLNVLIINLDRGISVLRVDLQRITDQVLPFQLKDEEFQRQFRAKRNSIYNELIDNIKPEGNYFIYGKDRLWAGGENVVSTLQEGNSIFPEFTIDYYRYETIRRKGRFNLILNGGEIDLQKISDDNRPLALEASMQGKVDINNGKWEFVTDGENILAKTTEALDINKQEVRTIAAADLRINYLTESGEEKIYDLDIDTQYNEPLSESALATLSSKITDVSTKTTALNAELKSILEDPVKRAIIDPLNKEIDRLTELRRKIWDRDIYWFGQQRRALQNPHRNLDIQNQRLDKIKEELTKIRESDFVSLRRIRKLRQNPDMLKIATIQNTISGQEHDLNKLEYQRDANKGDLKTGAFGQVVKPKGGGSGITYEEYIQGFPIRKNTEVFSPVEEVYNPRLGVTGSGERLEVPLVSHTNADKLQLDVLSNQECIDTQFRLAYEFALQSGQNICYGNGATCLRDFSNKQKFIRGWMGSQGTGSYNRQVDRRMGRDIEIIPPDQYDGIRAGDVLLLDGHAIGVKEVIEINGEKFVKQFAGSSPAIEAHIYHSSHGGLKSIKELKAEVENSLMTSVYRWKFRGRAKDPENTKLYELSTAPKVIAGN